MESCHQDSMEIEHAGLPLPQAWVSHNKQDTKGPEGLNDTGR
jgi:hypothetical protein